MGSLRAFIKDVRSAKTLAEERSIITKESAKIRTKLKDDHISLEKRRQNIHKLLYLYILGEKTHFAQVECINLISSDDFLDKRLGYLAAMLLLDENQEILTLLTNLLNNDLNHPNKYVVSLALTTLGSLTSPELARDLYPDVENILKHSRDTYLLKKALQVAAKLINRDVSLLEVFVSHTNFILHLLDNRDLCTHGVLFGITKLLQVTLLSNEAYEYEDYPQILNDLVKTIPELLSTLQSLNSTNFNPEFDVSGTCDPFLQVEILYTLRLFFQKFVSETMEYRDKLNDLLTQIATNTDPTKNSGHAILYEAVRTIFSLQSDQSLRVLGINILAKFLTSKDNNTKYVSLNSLLQVVPHEPSAVQRHRKFISRCLFDADVSIRMRSLELTFAILDESNMKSLVEELIVFLQSTDEDDKDLIVYTVEHLVNTFAIREVEDERWKLDVAVRMLKTVGEYITLEKIGDILIMINNVRDVNFKKEIVAQVLNIALDKQNDEVSEENLGWKLVTVWSVGEYADLVLGNGHITDTSLTQYLVDLNNLYANRTKLVSYVLTSALKLSTKISDPNSIEILRQLILSHTKDTNLMIQMKSIQYGILFNQPTNIKNSILEPMPIFVKKTKSSTPPPQTSNTAPTTKPKETDLLLDLLNDIPSSPPQQSVKPQQATDLLADIFSSSKPEEINETVNTSLSVKPQSETNSGAPDSVPFHQASVVVPANAVKLYDSASVETFGLVTSCSSGEARLEMFIKAKVDITDLQILIAVTKTQKLTLGSLTSTSVHADHVSRQLLKITGSGKLKLRVKLNFSAQKASANEQFDYKFEQSL